MKSTVLKEHFGGRRSVKCSQLKSEHVYMDISASGMEICVNHKRSVRVAMEVPNLTRGIAVLIIYTDFEFPKKSERKSALDDYENMREMFQHLNFDVRHIFNEPAAELLQKLKGIRDDIKESDECFVCMISSHGEEVPRSDSSRREHILFTNSGSVKTEDIVRMFNNKNCKCLNGKPRLFIIQACRTIFNSTKVKDGMDRGTDVNVIGTEEDNSKATNFNSSKPDALPYKCTNKDSTTSLQMEFNSCSVPCYNDNVVVFSSTSGMVSWSEEREGGWLPYCLYKTFRDKINKEGNLDVINLLTDSAGRVSRDMKSNDSSKRLSGAKSSIVVYHKLRKDFSL